MTHLLVLRGREYIFDGERWYNKRTFQAPTPADTLALSKMLQQELSSADDSSGTTRKTKSRKTKTKSAASAAV